MDLKVEDRSFFKYKSLINFEFILDILLKERLYAAKYNELNDPMEGCIKIDGTVPKEREAEWESIIQHLRIVCFTNNPNNPLMWSHYADGGRGCVIEFELLKNQIFHKASYLKKPVLNERDITLEKAIEILKYKEKPWKYEGEYRCILKENNYLPVNIKSITFGPKADPDKVEMLRHILQLCKPDLSIQEISNPGLVKKPIFIISAKKKFLVNQVISSDYCPKCEQTEFIQRDYVGIHRNWEGF